MKADLILPGASPGWLRAAGVLIALQLWQHRACYRLPKQPEKQAGAARNTLLAAAVSPVTPFTFTLGVPTPRNCAYSLRSPLISPVLPFPTLKRSARRKKGAVSVVTFSLL